MWVFFVEKFADTIVSTFKTNFRSSQKKYFQTMKFSNKQIVNALKLTHDALYYFNRGISVSIELYWLYKIFLTNDLTEIKNKLEDITKHLNRRRKVSINKKIKSMFGMSSGKYAKRIKDQYQFFKSIKSTPRITVEKCNQPMQPMIEETSDIEIFPDVIELSHTTRKIGRFTITDCENQNISTIIEPLRSIEAVETKNGEQAISIDPSKLQLTLWKKPTYKNIKFTLHSSHIHLKRPLLDYFILKSINPIKPILSIEYPFSQIFKIETNSTIPIKNEGEYIDIDRENEDEGQVDLANISLDIIKNSIQVDMAPIKNNMDLLRLRGGSGIRRRNSYNARTYNTTAHVSNIINVGSRFQNRLSHLDVTATQEMVLQGNTTQAYDFIDYNMRNLIRNRIFANQLEPNTMYEWRIAVKHDDGSKYWSRVVTLGFSTPTNLFQFWQNSSYPIRGRLGEMANRTRSSESSGLTNFNGFRLWMKKIVQEGGTSLLADNKRDHKGNIKIEGERWKFYNCKSINKNCAFAAFSHICDGKIRNKPRFDSVRQKLKIELNTEIKIDQLELIANYYKSSYECYSQVDKKWYQYTNPNSIHHVKLLLTGYGHYINLIGKIGKLLKCHKCGVENILESKLKNHHCSKKGITYYQSQIKNERILMPSNIPWATKNESDILLDRCWIFDIESLILQFLREGLPGFMQYPYGIGWKKLNIDENSWGKDEWKWSSSSNCISDFFDYMNKNVKEAILIGYNNSRFDNFILLHNRLKDMSKNKEIPYQIKDDQVCKNRGRITGFELISNTSHIKVFDLNLHIPGSLDSNCKNWKVKSELCKGKFDHNKIKCKEDGKKYECEWVPYLHNDLLATEQLFLKYYKSIYNNPEFNKIKTETRNKFQYYGLYKDQIEENKNKNKNKTITITEQMAPSILNYMTGPSLAYAIQLEYVDPRKNMIHIFNADSMEYMVCKSDAYGGRSYGTKKSWTHNNYDELIKMNGEEKVKYLKDNKGGSLQGFDLISNYPSAMEGVKNEVVNCKALYPVGEKYWYRNGREAYMKKYIGIYHIKFEPPKNIKFPIIPRRVQDFNMNVYENYDTFTKWLKSGVKWSVEDGEGYYDNVMIQRAIKHGYKVEFQNHEYAALVWIESEKLFESFIQPLKHIKMEQDQFKRDDKEVKEDKDKKYNASLRETAKNLLNSSYGKTTEQPETTETCIVTNFKKYNEMMDKGELIEDINTVFMGEDEFGRDQYALYVSVKLNERNNKRPCQLGSFILSYSKEIFDSYASCLVKDDLTKQPILVCDTDSIISYENAFDNLPEMKDDFGSFVDDLGGWIIDMKYLAPKVYQLEYVDYKTGELKYKNRIKGIPQSESKPIILNPNKALLAILEKNREDRSEEENKLLKLNSTILKQDQPLPVTILDDQFDVYFDNPFKRNFKGLMIEKIDMSRRLGVTKWDRMQWREDLNEFVPWGYDENWNKIERFSEYVTRMKNNENEIENESSD